MRRALTILVSMLAVVCGVSVVAQPAQASHSWDGLHWARSANPFDVDITDMTTGYSTYVNQATADWSVSNVLDTVLSTGSRPVTVQNGDYGATGWVGIASVWYDPATGHLQSGSVSLNDYYFAQSKYNTAAFRQFVTCQEIGHTLGLDHQDEIFTNTNLGSCMDYTNHPEGGSQGPANTSPNAHDYEQLETIYAHLDGGGGGGGSKPCQNVNSKGRWCRQVGSLQQFTVILPVTG